MYGGYAEAVYFPAKRLIPVSVELDPSEVVPLILNYIVAYQTLHRSAQVKAGNAVLIIGASGGIGTALLQLGRLSGLKMYGLASQSKHLVLAEYGATLIDYRTQDFVEVVHQLQPEGLDAVFDGIGGGYLKRGIGLLKRTGVWVSYANPLGLTSLVGLLGHVLCHNLLPGNRKLTLYGTGVSYINWRPFLQDWATLFELLGAGKIKPIIAARFPLLEAVQANALLESGQIVGNIVLVAPQL